MKEDLQQDVVEEKGAEYATQLLSLLDVPQGESLADVVGVRLLQPPHVHTTLQLAPDDKMSPVLVNIMFLFLGTGASGRTILIGMIVGSSNLWMWYSTQEVITWLVHWFIDSMALMICKETSSPF